MKNVIMLSVLSFMTACGANNSGSSSQSVESSTTTAIPSSYASAMVGCYTATSAQSSESSENTLAEAYSKLDKVCITSTGAGRNTRQGQFRFEFRTGEQLAKTLALSLTDAQPKCPFCYQLSGMLVSAFYHGQFPPSKSATLKLAFQVDKSTVSFELAKQ
jgi:hypothetical protein